MKDDDNNHLPLTKGLQGWTLGAPDGITLVLLVFAVGLTILLATL